MSEQVSAGISTVLPIIDLLVIIVTSFPKVCVGPASSCLENVYLIAEIGRASLDPRKQKRKIIFIVCSMSRIFIPAPMSKRIYYATLLSCQKKEA